MLLFLFFIKNIGYREDMPLFKVIDAANNIYCRY